MPPIISGVFFNIFIMYIIVKKSKMSIISEKIEGKIINVVINSSNIRSASYNSENETLTIVFTSGSTYEYYKVPWSVFTKFRLSESQGKFFNSNISKLYKYMKK